MNIWHVKRMNFFSIVLVTIIVIGSVVRISFGQQQTAFRITQGQTLDVQDILAQFTSGGKVSIRALFNEQDGQVSTNASILEELDRSGNSQFWEEIRQLVSGWEFTGNSLRTGAASYIDYSFIIPGALSEGDGETFVEVNCGALNLADGFFIDKEHPEYLVNSNDIPRANILITAVPKTPQGKKQTNIVKNIHSILSHLGWIFGGAFIILTIFLIIYLVKNWSKIFNRWSPNRRPRKKYLLFGKWVTNGEVISQPTYEEYQKDLYSKDAMEIRKMWENAIQLVQLPGSVKDIFKYKLKKEDAEEFVSFCEGTLKKSNVKIEDIYTAFKNKSFWGQIIGENDFIISPAADSIEKKEEIRKDDFKAELKKAATRPDIAEKVLELYGEVRDVKEDNQTKLGKLYREFQTMLGEDAHIVEDVLKFRKLDVVKKELERRKTIVHHLLSLWEQQDHWISMNDEDQRSCQDFVWAFFGRRQLVEALEKCNGETEKSYDLFEIFQTGIKNHLINGHGWYASQEIDRAIDRLLEVKLQERRSSLDGLWAIGSISPMIGLFGTVWGISQAFGKIGTLSNIKFLMSKLAGEINIALSTTIAGLIIGICAILSYYFFKSRIESTGAQIQKYFTDITNKI